jgi:hypothetical protein
MHPTPTGTRDTTTPPISLPDPEIFDQALPQPYQTRYADKKRHHVRPSTRPIRPACRRVLRRKEHTQRNEQIPKHLRIARQRIGEQYIPEFSILRFCESSDAYALECREGAVAAGAREERDGERESED